jgi:hypothetical protein
LRIAFTGRRREFQSATAGRFPSGIPPAIMDVGAEAL